MSGVAPWEAIGIWSHLGNAIVCAFAAVWLVRGGIGNTQRRAACVALGLTSVWALLAAVYSPLSLLALLAETARNLAWMFLLYRLFDGGARSPGVRTVRPVLAVMVILEVLQPLLLIVQLRLDGVPGAFGGVFQTATILHLLIAIGTLLLANNLHAGAVAANDAGTRWVSAAFAIIGVVELNFYTVAFLTGGVAVELVAIRGAAIAAAAIPLVIGLGRMSRSLRFQPSRAVAFQTISLFVIGLYFVAMVVIARSLTWLGDDYARLTQIAFLFMASIVALVWLPSERLRRWLRVMALKHLFKHRYDYRVEWLRLTQTIGRAGPEVSPLHERVVQALADITDSPGGMLLVPNDHGSLVLAARWRWPGEDVPVTGFDAGIAVSMFAGGFVCDIDDVRDGRSAKSASVTIPGWLLADEQAWAIVPLQHFERLTGLVVLSRPEIARKLDWEDFDLLRVAGQQLASYMAEHAGQEALNEASRFEEFNRRMAFVMHDIKNISSQLSLLTSNAERHIEKPAFRADMLLTLRNSAEKLNTLLQRLGRYGGHAGDKLVALRLDQCVERVVAQYARVYPVQLEISASCQVDGDQEGLEQALAHLVQNAIDASSHNAPVCLRVWSDGQFGTVEIVDTGAGMSPEFVRSRLFKPFVSSKQGGFGIGAFEARELIAGMHGHLDVESREGLGTRFVVRLPQAGTHDLIETLKSGEAKVA